MQNYFNISKDNNSSWIALDNSSLESLLNKAKEQEKKYEWLHAVDFYEKAFRLARKVKSLKAADINERIGYCYFRAALQAETKEQFKTRMQLASKTYRQTADMLHEIEGQEAKENHAKAMAAYTSSWSEPDLSKMETLLDEWWNLEKKALASYEKKQDLLAIGRTCNNLMEYSVDRRIWFNAREYAKRAKELVDIGERAIASLTKIGNKYELARAYCWTGFFYGKGLQGKHVKEDGLEKVQRYSYKALSLSEDLGDGWLIGWSYNSISHEGGLQAKSFDSFLSECIKVVEQGQKIRDNYMMLTGKWKAGGSINAEMRYEEDPEKKRENLKKAMKWTREAIAQAKLINFPIGIICSQIVHVSLFLSLAYVEANLQEKRKLMEEAIEVGREGLEYSKGRAWVHVVFPRIGLSKALFWLSKTETDSQEKRKHLEEALKLYSDLLAYFQASGMGFDYSTITFSDPQDLRLVPYRNRIETYYQIALIKSEIAKLETSKEQKGALFNEALLYWNECLGMTDRIAEALPEAFTVRNKEGFYYNSFGEVLSEVYAVTEEKSVITRAIEAYKRASGFFRKFKLAIQAANSYWRIALIYSQLGEHLESSKYYRLAAEAYGQTRKKTPQLKDFCENYSAYMLAWSEIAKATYYRSREKPQEARKHYEKAAKLHEESAYWSYMAPNYWAWVFLEDAELLSRQETPGEAIRAFKKAQKKFGESEEAIKYEIKEIKLPEEKKAAEKLVKTAILRNRYCRARIRLEEAKILDRKGEYASSSKHYLLAADILKQLLVKKESTQTQQELTLLVKLCEAWGKMELAEEKAGPDIYLEASQLFDQAKTYSPTRETTTIIMGNSSFCKGLAAGIEYQNSLDLSKHARAKSLIKSAATSYLQAGFRSASEYAKATQRLFDAYLFMNQAETEVDQEKRAKQYQMAEKLLQISAGSFLKAKQPEKKAEVQRILETVREEKDLANSLNQVLHAPSIASTTMSFAAPTPTEEISVGLERFEHANVQANLIAGVREVKVGESFCLIVEFVNAGKEPALLMRVEDFIPKGFVVVEKPDIYRLEDTCLNMKGKQLAPLKLVEAKLVLQPSKKGVYQLKPKVQYLDELGQPKSLGLKSLEIKVEEIILADRVPTGTKELDALLLGGIPECYAVALTGPPSDEREQVIHSFLEAGTKQDGITFHITSEPKALKTLLDKHPSTFYLFLCNPKPKIRVPDLPNVYKLHGKTDLNNLGIALVKAYRRLSQKPGLSKRVCVQILSDVLVNYGPKTARKWISELITDLGSKGFTMLAVVNPLMHGSEDLNAVLDLFDGEISLFQTEDPLECKKSIRVKKLRSQDFIKNSICLTKPI